MSGNPATFEVKEVPGGFVVGVSQQYDLAVLPPHVRALLQRDGIPMDPAGFVLPGGVRGPLEPVDELQHPLPEGVTRDRLRYSINSVEVLPLDIQHRREEGFVRQNLPLESPQRVDAERLCLSATLPDGRKQPLAYMFMSPLGSLAFEHVHGFQGWVPNMPPKMKKAGDWHAFKYACMLHFHDESRRGRYTSISEGEAQSSLAMGYSKHCYIRPAVRLSEYALFAELARYTGKAPQLEELKADLELYYNDKGKNSIIKTEMVGSELVRRKPTAKSKEHHTKTKLSLDFSFMAHLGLTDTSGTWPYALMADVYRLSRKPKAPRVDGFVDWKPCLPWNLQTQLNDAIKMFSTSASSQADKEWSIRTQAEIQVHLEMLTRHEDLSDSVQYIIDSMNALQKISGDIRQRIESELLRSEKPKGTSKKKPKKTPVASSSTTTTSAPKFDQTSDDVAEDVDAEEMARRAVELGIQPVSIQAPVPIESFSLGKELGKDRALWCRHGYWCFVGPATEKVFNRHATSAWSAQTFKDPADSLGYHLYRHGSKDTFDKLQAWAGSQAPKEYRRLNKANHDTYTTREYLHDGLVIRTTDPGGDKKPLIITFWHKVNDPDRVVGQPAVDIVKKAGLDVRAVMLTGFTDRQGQIICDALKL